MTVNELIKILDKFDPDATIGTDDFRILIHCTNGDDYCIQTTNGLVRGWNV